jgi:hypothetical protein
MRSIFVRVEPTVRLVTGALASELHMVLHLAAQLSAAILHMIVNGFMLRA